MSTTICKHCGGIVSTDGVNVNAPHMKDRVCKCEKPDPAPAIVSSTHTVHPTITEEQVRKIVHEEVAKALADIKPHLTQEVQQDLVKQVRTRTGMRKAEE